MKDAILKWIGKHERVHYLLRCIHHFADQEYVHETVYPYESLLTLKVEQKGNKHRGNVLYKIERDTSGFFANFIFVLSDIWYAESMGMCPVIVWSKDCPYYEEKGVEGQYNVWEYYFLQYQNLNAEDLNSAFRVATIAKDVRRLAFGIENGYKVTHGFINEMARVMNKYIKLNKKTELYISQKVSDLGITGKKVLGVHIRMGGMLGNYNEHPIVPTLEDYIEAIRDISEKYDYIFLATDDNRALKRIQDEFGDCVLYYDFITRVDGEYSTYCIHSKEEQHNYRCGLDALLDMYTLAECNGLVAGMSQLSLASRIAKASYEKEYEDLIIIDKGINHNRRKAPSGPMEKRIY